MAHQQLTRRCAQGHKDAVRHALADGHDAGFRGRTRSGHEIVASFTARNSGPPKDDTRPLFEARFRVVAGGSPAVHKLATPDGCDSRWLRVVATGNCQERAVKRSLAGRRLRSLCTGAAQPALMSTSGPVGEHHVRQTARYSEAQARRMRWAAASHSLPVPRSCHPIIVYHAPSGACTPSIQQGTMRMTSSCHANVQDLLLIHPLEVSEVVWAVAVARRRVMDIASAASLRARRRSTTGALPASLCMAEVCWRAFQVSRTHTGRARTGLVGLPEVECDRWARRAQPCPVGSAAWITISYSSFAIASASSISISSSARLARGIAPRRTLADGAVSAHSRMAVGMIVATFAATRALQNESTHHPTPSSHRGSRLAPTTVPYISPTASTGPPIPLALGIPAIPRSGTSRIRNTNPYRLGVRGAPGDGAPLTTKRHQ